MAKVVTSLCVSDNFDVITGDSTGSIVVWSIELDDVFRMNHHASSDMMFAHKVDIQEGHGKDDDDDYGGGGGGGGGDICCRLTSISA